MKLRSKVKITIALFCLCVAMIVGFWGYQTFDTSRSSVADDVKPLADVVINDAVKIARGEYIMHASDCSACHSSDKGDFAGGHSFSTDFGVLLSSNITPDRDTGIGNMTERDFFNAVRHGQGSKGLLYPAMPYTAFVNINDEDMHDLWAYMSTIKPIKNNVIENAGLNFPYNIRLAMAGWNMLFFKNRPFRLTENITQLQSRGKYLVEGLAHCSVCHTPRNGLGAEIKSAGLQGGFPDGWYAPDITSNRQTGIGSYNETQLKTYLKTGANDSTIAAGPMAEAIEDSLQYLTDDDVTAIVEYLKTVPSSEHKRTAPMAIDDASFKNNALVYEVNCSACHGLKGEGIKGMIPPFAGNRSIVADDPTNLIHAMLQGARAPHTSSLQTAAGMPSFDWKMNDKEIAEILDYIRNSWGNSAKKVDPEHVRRMRSDLRAMEKLGMQ